MASMRSSAATSSTTANGLRRDGYATVTSWGCSPPQGTVAVDPDRDDDIGPEEGDDAASGGIQDGRSPRPVLAQSSMGLSFVVDGSVNRLIARCSWGQYDREFEDQDDGSRASVWVRTPREVDVDLALDERASLALCRSTVRASCCGAGPPVPPMGIRG